MDSITRVVIDGQQAFAIIGTVLWVMLRIGAMLVAMPMVGSRSLPARVRAMLALVLAMALAPVVPPVPAWNGFDAAAVLTIARELAVGVVIGFLLRLIFEAGSMAGELIAQGTGLAFAQMSDPLRGGSSGVIGQWFYLLFGLLFFASNGHLALISLLVDSYTALPIGTALPDPHAMAALAPTLMLQMMRGALTLALPLTVAMLAMNLAFGVLAKAAPALHPMQFGLPVSLLLGLVLLMLLSAEMAGPVQRLFDTAFDSMRQVTM
ncbi:MAG: flagellar biosynthetic protein FliR [Stenotrophomonas sp.]